MNRIDYVNLKLAVVEGSINDFAVYVAFGHWSDDDVRTNGMKLSLPVVRSLIDMGLISEDWSKLSYRY